jgi:arginyl-tRNA synthetase
VENILTISTLGLVIIPMFLPLPSVVWSLGLLARRLGGLFGILGVMEETNSLKKINDEINTSIIKKAGEVLSRRKERGYVRPEGYFVIRLDAAISLACNDFITGHDIDISFLDRNKYKADVAVKIPSFLKGKGAETYTKEIVPKIISAIEASPLVASGLVKSVEQMGIYVNLILDDNQTFSALGEVFSFNDRYGELDFYSDKSIVIDYSSPNMAKHLHPGHIRSTIAGEVLANIYEAVGYTVHRLNYLNDWGGVTYIMEGYIHWKDKIVGSTNKNDLLYSIYLIYREGEKVAGSEETFNKLSIEAKSRLVDYFGPFNTYAEFVDKYKIFDKAARDRFCRLEAGDKEEVSLWQQMRGWSLEEFAEFYDLLDVRHDYLTGESFFAPMGKELLDRGIKSGKIFKFTQELADKEKHAALQELKSGDASEDEYKSRCDGADKDVGAYITLLDDYRRLVLGRADGATIYATRDLASIEYRNKTFNADRLVYEVGQEQKEYFERLFEAAKQLGLLLDRDVNLAHLSHGFYLDADSKKKLSSRDGALNVASLINESIKYFRKKYDERNDAGLSDKEKDVNARMIAVGSIVFNDVKQERRFPIFINKDLTKTIAQFEESGGAYIMYTSARAKSIVRKSGVSKIADKLEVGESLNGEELVLVKQILDFPRVVLKAAESDNAAVLAGYLLSLSNFYNSYYEKFRVLGADGKIDIPHRLTLAAAVARVLDNGMRICHAPAPDII